MVYRLHILRNILSLTIFCLMVVSPPCLATSEEGRENSSLVFSRYSPICSNASRDEITMDVTSIEEVLFFIQSGEIRDICEVSKSISNREQHPSMLISEHLTLNKSELSFKGLYFSQQSSLSSAVAGKIASECFYARSIQRIKLDLYKEQYNQHVIPRAMYDELDSLKRGELLLAHIKENVDVLMNMTSTVIKDKIKSQRYNEYLSSILSSNYIAIDKGCSFERNFSFEKWISEDKKVDASYIVPSYTLAASLKTCKASDLEKESLIDIASDLEAGIGEWLNGIKEDYRKDALDPFVIKTSRCGEENIDTICKINIDKKYITPVELVKELLLSIDYYMSIQLSRSYSSVMSGEYKRFISAEKSCDKSVVSKESSILNLLKVEEKLKREISNINYNFGEAYKEIDRKNHYNDTIIREKIKRYVLLSDELRRKERVKELAANKKKKDEDKKSKKEEK